MVILVVYFGGFINHILTRGQSHSLILLTLIVGSQICFYPVLSHGSEGGLTLGGWDYNKYLTNKNGAIYNENLRDQKTKFCGEYDMSNMIPI